MINTKNLIVERFNELLDSKSFHALRNELIALNAVDIALLFDAMPRESLPVLFRLLPKELAAEVFVEMDYDSQEHLIKGFSDSELKAVVDELFVDDVVDIIEEMPANVVKRILMQADHDMRKHINEILQYPPDSAGSIMTTEFVNLRPEMTVSDAIKHIKRTGLDKETINTCYVTQNKKLLGYVSMRSLILNDEDKKLSEIMEPNVIFAQTHEDQETVAHMFKKYGLLAIPVVDNECRLVGIVTVDDAIDVMTDETTEDISKMAAVIPSDKPYLKTSTFTLWKTRVPWLLFLMFSATFTGIIIAKYEAALQTLPALMVFIPMLMDSGGNASNQACTTIIRGLSLREIRFSDIFRIVWKESRVALLCGLTLALFNFARIMLIDRLDIVIAFVVCITLVVDVFIAKLIGSSLPILATKIGLDPAVMASPLITTIVDALALLIYFGFASALLF